jgi:nitrogen regulatory protein PII
MKLFNANLLTITCEILAQKDILEILNRHEITKITSYEVDGNGSRGIRGQGFKNEKNIKIETISTEEKLKDVVEEISRTLFPDFGIILYLSNVQVVRPEKFI